MKIEHVAIWTDDLERLKDFYINFFGAKANKKYINESKKFSSYFLTFEGDSRLEIMEISDLAKGFKDKYKKYIGLTHLAISVGSKEKVLELTKSIKGAGYDMLGEPRTTGDGYFESVVADPDGNRIEITI